MPDFTDNLTPRYDGAATLQAERNGSAIDAEELAKHLLSRDGFLERQAKVLKVLSKEKLFSKEQQMNLSRPERYHLGLARAKAIQRIVRREGWDHEDYKICEYLNDEMSPYHLHMTMFGKFQILHPAAFYHWDVRADWACSNDDPRASIRISKAILAAQDPQLGYHWLLCPKRAGPWQQRPWDRDRRQVGSGEEGIRAPQPASDS